MLRICLIFALIIFVTFHTYFDIIYTCVSARDLCKMCVQTGCINLSDNDRNFAGASRELCWLFKDQRFDQ